MDVKLKEDLCEFFKKIKRGLLIFVLLVIASMAIALAIGKAYQRWDNNKYRGAVPMSDGQYSESYDTPVYLDQGWDEADSLWFYNITQGSALIPYDLFLSLERLDSEELLRSPGAIDQYRYLPQQASFFNPDALPVGIVKDEYDGKDYIGYTCSACHTSQVNYKGKAIRIDGGPAMADMVGFLTEMEKAMYQTLQDKDKNARFVNAVLALDNDYSSKEEINNDLKRWAKNIFLYNEINHSSVDYGYARLDAFGRIYNRVLQYVPNRVQVYDALTQAVDGSGHYIISDQEAEKVLQGVDETIIGNDQFVTIIDRLASTEEGYPGLTEEEFDSVKFQLFNEPNAPVSYPFLWDIVQSDYVQWNGIQANAGVGALGRNTGEVVGVFAKLDWQARDPWFSLSAAISKQDNKKKKIKFTSSVDLTNLKRIESHLKSLKSPLWSDAVEKLKENGEEVFPAYDESLAKEGRKIYGQYCQSCHELIDRNDWNRVVINKMTSLDKIGTDRQMAENSVAYTGYSGNFEDTYQSTDIGDVIVEQEAPVAVLLKAAVSGVVATPDPDKNILRRRLDWLYTLVSSVFDNDIKPSMKVGNYEPDTTANPFQSLLSYKARSLNGIWATAPYLHNGSVPTLYDLLLPADCTKPNEDGECRPAEFEIGSREFDPIKVGFKSQGYGGQVFDTALKGNHNTGHEYAAGQTSQANGDRLPALNKPQRLALLEFLKTL